MNGQALAPVPNRGMITISIMLANIMQGVDNTILNVALPHTISANGAIAPSVLLDGLLAPRLGFDLGGDATHTHGLKSFSLIFEEPLSWPAFDQTIAVLTALRGPDPLRIKGRLAVEECRGPVVVVRA